jgi:hypothetical protein
MKPKELQIRPLVFYARKDLDTGLADLEVATPMAGFTYEVFRVGDYHTWFVSGYVIAGAQANEKPCKTRERAKESCEVHWQAFARKCLSEILVEDGDDARNRPYGRSVGGSGSWGFPWSLIGL